MVRVLLVLAVIMVSGCDAWGDGFRSDVIGQSARPYVP
jgi:hypothetical protein